MSATVPISLRMRMGKDMVGPPVLFRHCPRKRAIQYTPAPEIESKGTFQFGFDLSSVLITGRRAYWMARFRGQ
jgi:hypothetical protein